MLQGLVLGLGPGLLRPRLLRLRRWTIFEVVFRDGTECRAMIVIRPSLCLSGRLVGVRHRVLVLAIIPEVGMDRVLTM